MIISLLLFLICNTAGPRKFLSDLVGEDFIIKYFGRLVYSELLMIVLYPFIVLALAVVVAEISASISLHKHLEAMDQCYQTLYGVDSENWSEQIKLKYLTQFHNIHTSVFKQGLVTKILHYIHQ